MGRTHLKLLCSSLWPGSCCVRVSCGACLRYFKLVLMKSCPRIFVFLADALRSVGDSCSLHRVSLVPSGKSSSKFSVLVSACVSYFRQAVLCPLLQKGGGGSALR